MLRICNVCGLEQEHKSWKSTTCNNCLNNNAKSCSKCGETKPLEAFYKCRGEPAGMCKECEKNRSHAGKVASGYLSRPDVIEKRNASSRECHKKRLANIDKRTAVYASHNARLRERYANDAQYRQKRINDIIDRKRNTAATSVITGAELQKCFEYFNNTCAYCGCSTSLTQDHVKPVSSGGIGEIFNIIPACKSCNSSKHAKDMEAWYSKQKFFSEKQLTKIKAWIGGEPICP